MDKQTQVDGAVGSDSGGSQSVATRELRFVDVRYWMPMARVLVSLPLAVPCVIPGFEDFEFVTSVDVGELQYHENVMYSVSERTTGFWVPDTEANTREEAIENATLKLRNVGVQSLRRAIEKAKVRMNELAASPAQAPGLSNTEGTADQSDSTKEDV